MELVDNSFTESSKGQQVLKWLLDRGISQKVIGEAGLKWNGTHIVIPIRDGDGKTVFNKYRRDPERSIGPKYSYDKGAMTALYMCDIGDLAIADEIVICEGELDCLRLLSAGDGFFACSSTGGAGTFKEEWAVAFAGKKVWVVFDNDEAGLKGSIKVCRLIPHANFVRLPASVGDHGDVTDYLKTHDADQFERLLATGEPLPPEEKKRERRAPSPTQGTRLAKAKAYPLTELLGIREMGTRRSVVVRCPIHNEKTGSFRVYADNRWYCFGCGRGGDTVDFVMLRDALTMPEAIKAILELK